jgi:flavin-dependent dehydrogenase
LAGDAARVVEPFTGEGIYYALASGELAARWIAGGKPWREFAAAHAALYRGRLWVNRLAKWAVCDRLAGDAMFALLGRFPSLAALLTAKVVGR